MLKVDPRKNMTFNPRESIDFNGNTGPFIQYTYARIQSIFRKATEKGIAWSGTAPVNVLLNDKENNLVRTISNFSNVVMEAGNSFSPALIANYVYDLAKEYNQFYHESPIGLKKMKICAMLDYHCAWPLVIPFEKPCGCLVLMFLKGCN
jgi:arginyl-tRNA synthetase